jgi:D-aminopeptidase
MAPRVRARDLGIPFDGQPGPLNAITDVPGVRVGHVTLIRDGQPDLSDAVRTGVTAILPRPDSDRDPTTAGWFSLNGYGELTGTVWLDEAGLLDGPILTTNTASVGTVRDGILEWARRHRLPDERWSLPVVGETWDGFLNDLHGMHVQKEHAIDAIDRASPGPVAEGNVGGGTGMICYEFKGGIGTSSRQVGGATPYHVGVLVQANHGLRDQLRVAGVPLGRRIPMERVRKSDSGSILIFVATDAPLLPHQLKRLARRCSLGLARSGSISGHGSGDLFLAFSTGNPGVLERPGVRTLSSLSESEMNPLFEGVVQATDEAVVNALVGAESMTGFHGHRVEALPHEAVRREFGS